MRGAIPPLPNTPSWRGAQLEKKHRYNFTFTFYLCSWINTGSRNLRVGVVENKEFNFRCKILIPNLIKTRLVVLDMKRAEEQIGI
jgi:hypothetical protein